MMMYIRQGEVRGTEVVGKACSVYSHQGRLLSQDDI